MKIDQQSSSRKIHKGNERTRKSKSDQFENEKHIPRNFPKPELLQELVCNQEQQKPLEVKLIFIFFNMPQINEKDKEERTNDPITLSEILAKHLGTDAVHFFRDINLTKK